ncbi:MAG: hypothetical protein KGS72_03085 [Cyanobacteria bacterium REEB67]|nr:hypothetical protein [Cyanobacteria bacterium REEB67]
MTSRPVVGSSKSSLKLTKPDFLATSISTNGNTYSLPPTGRDLKQRPTDVQIYERDTTPLGDRSPFLMVHGLRGEYQPAFRWQKLQDYLTKSPAFNTRYKIYTMRYSSLDRIGFNLDSYKNAFARLYDNCQQRPITVLALSMGGNLAYEAMTDKTIEAKTQRLFTFGTPFHGSPLFAGEWLDYSIYRRFSFPWTRVERKLTYQFYFRENKQLRDDLSWDNVDNAIPNPGKFRSLLPLGPSGELTVGNTTNERLIQVNERPVDKRKLVTYGGYMLNPYLARRDKRILESPFLYPFFAFFTSFPAHFGREHAALSLINKDMSCVQTTKEVEQKAGSPFIYVLNDGIAPLSSAIFLPKEAAREQYLAFENDVEKLKNKVDVGQARVFRNIDHLTFIGSKPKTKITAALHFPLKDELNPQDQPREMFAWILDDVLAPGGNNDQVTGRLADGKNATTVKGTRVKVAPAR